MEGELECGEKGLIKALGVCGHLKGLCEEKGRYEQAEKKWK